QEAIDERGIALVHERKRERPAVLLERADGVRVVEDQHVLEHELLDELLDEHRVGRAAAHLARERGEGRRDDRANTESLRDRIRAEDLEHCCVEPRTALFDPRDLREAAAPFGANTLEQSEETGLEWIVPVRAPAGFEARDGENSIRLIADADGGKWPAPAHSVAEK